MSWITEKALRSIFSEIAWDEPVPVTVAGGDPWFVCRYCIAVHGLRANEIVETPYAFASRDEALGHIHSVHPRAGERSS